MTTLREEIVALRDEYKFCLNSASTAIEAKLNAILDHYVREERAVPDIDEKAMKKEIRQYFEGCTHYDFDEDFETKEEPSAVEGVMKIVRKYLAERKAKAPEERAGEEPIAWLGYVDQGMGHGHLEVSEPHAKNAFPVYRAALAPAAPASAALSPSAKIDIIADVHFLPTNEGGKKNPTPEDFYGCPLKYEDEYFDCRLMLDGNPIAPGETRRVPIAFLWSERAKRVLRVGSKFELWEIQDCGTKATGVVVEII